MKKIMSCLLVLISSLPAYSAEPEFKHGDQILYYHRPVSGAPIYRSGTFFRTEGDNLIVTDSERPGFEDRLRNEILPRTPGICNSVACSGRMVKLNIPPYTQEKIEAVLPDGTVLVRYHQSRGSLYNNYYKALPLSQVMIIDDVEFEDLTEKSCQFENPKIAKLNLSDIRSRKTFRSSEDSKSHRKCREEGFDICVTVKEPGTSRVFNPFGVIGRYLECPPTFPCPYSNFASFPKAGEVLGLKLKNRSPEKIQRDSCPVLLSCAEGATGIRLSTIEHYIETHQCSSREPSSSVNNTNRSTLVKENGPTGVAPSSPAASQQ